MNRKLTVEHVRKCVEVVYYEGYTDGFNNRGCHLEETDWQAITDELNSLLAITLEETEVYCKECFTETYKREREFGEIFDALIERVDELAYECYRYKLQFERYKAWIDKLESLLKEFDRFCRGCEFPCYTEEGKCSILQRIDEIFGL